MAAAKPSHYTVATSFLGALDGDAIEFHKGEVIEAEDPAYKLWPEKFEPLVVRDHLKTKGSKVEKATAAPGEKRA